MTPVNISSAETRPSKLRSKCSIALYGGERKGEEEGLSVPGLRGFSSLQNKIKNEGESGGLSVSAPSWMCFSSLYFFAVGRRNSDVCVCV